MWIGVYQESYEKMVLSSNQILHYTRCITPKRVTSFPSPSPRHCSRETQPHLRVIAPGKHSSIRRNVAVVAIRWQYCPI